MSLSEVTCKMASTSDEFLTIGKNPGLSEELGPALTTCENEEMLHTKTLIGGENDDLNALLDTPVRKDTLTLKETLTVEKTSTLEETSANLEKSKENEFWSSLTEYEELFKDRYTSNDAKYMERASGQLQPLILHPFGQQHNDRAGGDRRGDGRGRWQEDRRHVDERNRDYRQQRNNSYLQRDQNRTWSPHNGNDRRDDRQRRLRY